MKLVYIAGPYRGPTREAVELNIACARRIGVLVAKHGHYPVIPHSKTAGFEHIAPDIHDEFWLAGTLELMRRCDAVVLCPGWKTSSGTLTEVDVADSVDMQIYETVEDFLSEVEKCTNSTITKL